MNTPDEVMKSMFELLKATIGLIYRMNQPGTIANMFVHIVLFGCAIACSAFAGMLCAFFCIFLYFLHSLGAF